MKKIMFFAAIMLLCPFASKAFWYKGWIQSGGSNPNGLLRIEIRDSIALIIAPDSSDSWNSVNYNYEWVFHPYMPSGDITIPSYITYEGTNYPVRIIGWKAFFYCDGITSITIPNTVKQIHNYAFGCPDFSNPNNYTGGTLNSVIFTGTINQWCKIWFKGSHANPTIYAHSLRINGNLITDLVIPEGVDRIRGYAFAGCSNLTSVTIPTTMWDIEDGAFMDCIGLNTVNYNARNCGFTVNYDGIFQGCNNLQTVTIGENVQSIPKGAFSNKNNLNKVYMKPLTPPSVYSNSFENNASNRVFILSGCSYDTYYNDSQWSTYRDALRDPIIDIDVNASSNNTSQGTVSFIKQRNHIVHCDSTAVVQANAKTGYHFDCWSDGSTDNPYTIHLTGDTTIIAYFATGTQDIEDIEGGGILISVVNGHIVVEGADGETVAIYDVMGRNVIGRVNGTPRNFNLPTGVYMVKVGTHPARKVVVVR